jgi:hypothetical protein
MFVLPPWGDPFPRLMPYGVPKSVRASIGRGGARRHSFPVPSCWCKSIGKTADGRCPPGILSFQNAFPAFEKGELDHRTSPLGFMAPKVAGDLEINRSWGFMKYPAPSPRGPGIAVHQADIIVSLGWAQGEVRMSGGIRFTPDQRKIASDRGEWKPLARASAPAFDVAVPPAVANGSGAVWRGPRVGRGRGSRPFALNHRALVGGIRLDSRVAGVFLTVRPMSLTCGCPPFRVQGSFTDGRGSDDECAIAP